MQATLEALAEEMARDPAIFVMGEGIGKRGGNFKTTAGLFDLYGPVRLCDTPICERGFVGLGCGAAMTGTRPVIDFMFADFVLDCRRRDPQPDRQDPVHEQRPAQDADPAARLHRHRPLGGHAPLGQLLPMFAHFPGLRVVVPSTPYDAKGLLKQALRCNDPVLFLEHRELLASRARCPTRTTRSSSARRRSSAKGRDVTVVALALMVHHTLKACERLAAEGISVELIDPRTVAPLDVETIRQSVAKTGRLLIVDEAFAPFGIGAEIAAQLADRGLRRSRCPDPPAQRRLHADAVQPAAGSRRRPERRTRSPRRSATSWPSEVRIDVMAIEITIPRLGWNMDEGIFVGWLKSDGEHVSRPASRSSAWRETRRRRISRAWKPGSCAFRPTAPRTARRSPSAP